MKLSWIIFCGFLCNVALALDEMQLNEKYLQSRDRENLDYVMDIPGGVGDCYVYLHCQGSPFARQVSAEWCSQSIGAGSFYNRSLGACYNF